MSEVVRYVEENRQRFLAELKELIAIPSISTDPGHKADVQRCAEWLRAHLEGLGMEQTEVFPTAGHPAVYGEWLNAPGRPTLLLYGHYDVQPADPVARWTSPPFEATVRDGRVYGRGTADDKGQFFIHLKAAEACLQTTGRLPVNLKLILEGEEEIGGPHLPGVLAEHRERLRADLAVISDTPFFAPGVPSVCYGMRGITQLEIEVEGPNRDLHSGSYGGAVHNPIQALAEIIAALHDSEGRVAMPGFYDEVAPLTAQEREAFAQLPWDDEEYARSLGVKKLYGEPGYSTLERVWARPTLDCHGIWGGFTDEGVKTVLPSKAGVKVSMRLVPNQSPEEIARLVEDFVKTRTPETVRSRVRLQGTAEPALTPLDSAGVQAAAVALEKGFGRRPVFQREGGSIPVLTYFKKALGLDTVLLGFGLPDENAHAPDEFIDLGNFFTGIEVVAHFYQELARKL